MRGPAGLPGRPGAQGPVVSKSFLPFFLPHCATACLPSPFPLFLSSFLHLLPVVPPFSSKQTLSLTSFLIFLQGPEGESGLDGKPGIPGTKVSNG